ncbi:hypothetical protein GLO73106DRAFT_00018910 [Gloeocapsa sp. PCC 73106]|nr:hypothetical protein GLO73106DRAFT_00018910 [Gloeocapsa sp. PCC 73106]
MGSYTFLKIIVEAVYLISKQRPPTYQAEGFELV